MGYSMSTPSLYECNTCERKNFELDIRGESHDI